MSVAQKNNATMTQNKNSFRIGKTHITATNPHSAISKIKEATLKGNGGYICVSNMRMIHYAGLHDDYRLLMDESLMNLPDGKPLTWLGKLWGQKNISCTNGPALFRIMLSEGPNECKHYLLGDTQDVLDDILRLNKEIYHSNIVGAEALPFCNVADFDYNGISKRLKKTGANVVWTAMRAPKQDQFNQILCKHNKKVVALGVGRAFRLLTGSVVNAPEWAHKMGIAGIFTRKVALSEALMWYFKTFFFLIGYAVNIVLAKISGRKYYD